MDRRTLTCATLQEDRVQHAKHNPAQYVAARINTSRIKIMVLHNAIPVQTRYVRTVSMDADICVNLRVVRNLNVS